MSVRAAEIFETRWVRSDRVVGRRIAGEYVLVPIARSGAEVDSIFTLNGVGAYIWEHLDGSRSGHDVVAALGREFEVDDRRARKDYCDFVRKLQSIGAVQETVSEPR